jgi:hypothetical protein
MSDCKPSPTPFQSRVKLRVDCESPLDDATLYHQLVGILISLTHSRFDIFFIISMVSKFLKNTHENHWKTTKRILGYLPRTRNHVVFYS